MSPRYATPEILVVGPVHTVVLGCKVDIPPDENGKLGRIECTELDVD